MEKSLLKKGIIVVILLLFIGASALPSVMSEEKQNILESIKTSDVKFCSRGPLQDMINYAAPYDTIIVPCGIYHENIIVWKPLILEGNNCVTIDGGGTGDVVNITADDVTIRGFTIQNSGYDYYSANILIWGNNTIIKNNNISNNDPTREAHGIMNMGWVGWYTGQNLFISCNTFWNNFVGIGLWWSGAIIPSIISCNMFSTNTFKSSIAINFGNCYNNIISCNNISTQSYSWKGIGLNTCDDNEISCNTIWATPPGYFGYGIYLADGNCHGNIVTGNTVKNSYCGITIFGLDPSNPNWVYHNNFMNSPNDNAIDNSYIPNNYDDGSSGNYWDDKGSNPCYPPNYCITGSAGSIDHFPLSAPYICPNPPTTPTITGPTRARSGDEHDYEFVATDPSCDCLIYIVDWGDNSPFEVSELVDDGTPTTLSHTWDQQGTYTIRAQARSLCGGESGWGTLVVEMPKNKMLTNTLFLRLFERFPNLFPILRLLLGL